MQDINNYLPNIPRDRIWLFNSAGTFSGNVKYLFIHITRNRPDIFACYMSADESTISYIQSLGYRACLFDSPEGKNLMNRAGVYVNEQCKEGYPPELLDTKMLNLFHGVGLKQIERKCERESVGLQVAKKYINYNEYFYKNMCFLVTSPFMEAHFKEQLCLSDEQIVRAGYPRCVYPICHEPVSTFDHNLLEIQGLPADTKIALYAPTYREQSPDNFLHKSIGDIYSLIEVLKKNNILLIVKLHPHITRDLYFKKLQKTIYKVKNIILWDNQYDIYEIFDKIDIGIVDYSSIYYDLLAAGVKKFIRYIFDFGIEGQYMLYDYIDHTSGAICKNFDELLRALDSPPVEDEVENMERIKSLFWSYSDADACEKIIEQTMAFQPRENISLPTLYSFDVFDTIISRKVLQPRGIFYYVMENICRSAKNFPEIFKTEYVAIRMQAESNVREFITKDNGAREITFDAIFDRLNDVYQLSQEQTDLLKQWELDAEFENVIPVPDKINFAEQLIKDGEQVVLISDMYLAKSVLVKMIHKVSPLLAEAPLFLSSEYGTQKTTQKLYLDVYRHFTPYLFKEWHHYGDNKIADGERAKGLGITPHLHPIPTFNAYEQGLVNRCKDYDSYLVAGLLSRMRVQHPLKEKEYFAFAHIGCYYAPYIAWVVRDAMQRGLGTLYFISRDGYFLKKVADAFISCHRLSIKTKYIYGSRRVWRVPAMAGGIDDKFFSYFGNITGCDSYEKLLGALHMPHHLFQKMFPELGLRSSASIAPAEMEALRDFFKNSPKYKDYLLKKSAQEREIVAQYLKQEIDFSEQFAFVEFWGRGYTQSALRQILETVTQEKAPCIFYYYRSILPTQGDDIRYNFSTNNTSLIFIESIFANHPYETVASYKKEKDVIVPVADRAAFDAELFWAMEKYLPLFVREFYSLPFQRDVKAVERRCSDFSLYWYRDRQDDPILVNALAHLLYSAELWGERREFAPAFSATTLEQLRGGKSPASLTHSLKMSLARSAPAIRSAYQAIRKNPSKAVPLSPTQTRKVRLRAKLEKNPDAFFADSRIKLVKFMGKVCLSKVLRPFLGQGLVYLTKRIYRD